MIGYGGSAAVWEACALRVFRYVATSGNTKTKGDSGASCRESDSRVGQAPGVGASHASMLRCGSVPRNQSTGWYLQRAGTAFRAVGRAGIERSNHARHCITRSCGPEGSATAGIGQPIGGSQEIWCKGSRTPPTPCKGVFISRARSVLLDSRIFEYDRWGNPRECRDERQRISSR